MTEKTPEERQVEIEQEAVAMGAARYRGERMAWHDKDKKGREEAELTPGKMLLSRNVGAVAEGIAQFLDAAFNQKRAGRKHVAAPYLLHIDPLQAAYLALRNCVNGAATMATVSLVGRRIGDAVQEHIEMQHMAADHPGLYHKLSAQLAKSTSAKHRLGVLRHVREKYSLDTLSWDIKERILVGSKLMELVLERTGMFEIRQVSRGRNDRPQCLFFTPATAEWLEKAHGRCELLSPIHLPMIVPPRPWHSPYTGGYLTDAYRLRLVRARSRAYIDELGGVDLTPVMSAVNAIQATPWRINKRVLEAIDTERAMGGGGVGLPRMNPLPLPPKPAGLPKDRRAKLTASQRETLTAWKARAAKVYEANAKAECERITLAQKLYVAHRFAPEQAIYFPHYLDFRGRVYPLASYLNPQSDDLGRGLLEFAEGKPLGEDGAFWLAVHIAGLWGVDKVSFQERYGWVREHEEAILAAALDPHADDAFWRTAEKPWQALAACFEWLGYSYNGDAHVSHLPIAMDGSCSGLQHYSALLRDEIGGAAVNLVPGDKPADIYTKVAGLAQELSDGQLGGTNDEVARAWKGKFCRKVAKQPTMTLCYSATQYGMKDQIERALAKLDEEHGGRYLNGTCDNHTAALYAADVIWHALDGIVVAASRAMRWLKKVSDLMCAAEMPVRWTAPIGLPVMQEYRKSRAQMLEVYIGGQRFQLQLRRDDGTPLSKRRQGSGIAPNFVHSLDASHLLATVNLAVLNGLTSFAVIHDSFAVHACDTTLLNAVLRESFVAQYRQPILEELRAEIVAQLEVVKPALAEKVPPVPPAGGLDLEAVKESEFFFA